MRAARAAWRLAGAVALLVLTLTLAPAAAGAATPPAGLAGLGGWSIPTPVQAQQLGQSGLRTWRAGLVWDWVESQPGRRHWGYLDQVVGDGARHGYDVLLVLNGCAQWACGATRVAPFAEPQLGAYRAFITAAVQRYGRGGAFWAANPSLPQRPVSWQVWNEVNAGQDWPTPSAATYAPFLAAMSQTIKSVDPTATVVASGLVEHPAIASGATLSSFLSDLYAQPGFRESFDVLAVHGYAENPTGVARILDTARRLVDRHGDAGRRIWVTELGFSSGGPAHPFTSDEATQAANLQQSYDLLVGCRDRWNLERAYWFSLGDIEAAALGEPDYWGMHTGLRRTDGTLKAAWNAFAEYLGERPLPPGRGDACPLAGGGRLDARELDTTIVSAPSVVGGRAPQRVTFTATREATFECSLDGAEFSPCRSPYVARTTREGGHELLVRAVDGGGITDPNPARATWILDLTPPDTVMTSKPPRAPKGRRVRMRFAGVDATGVRAFQCRQLGRRWKSCRSGQLHQLRGRGLRRLQVRAVDRAGNVDPAPAQAKVTVSLRCLKQVAGRPARTRCR